ncbi:hypothetical protein DBA29_17270 [Xenophilus aerolatus]|nr:hypothetical protein [Xenophilus aerolatus]
MTIGKGDLKLLKSLNMSDTPDGGGGPSSDQVADGVSNEIFLGVSESDRAVGRVSLRQLHATVQSHDQDTFLGANFIVAEPPADPNVSITVFSTGGVFDTRSEAISRLEAYLGEGSRYAGYLFGNHIAGMRTVQILQRTEDVPPIGATLVLRKREGFSDEYTQFVRVTEAAVVQRTFNDISGEYTRYELGLKISDALRVDFPGFDAQRIDPTKAELATLTKIANTIVADAARYYGVVDLEEEGEIGDFTIKASGIFTQLVPSAQVETGIADARINQVSESALKAGNPIGIDAPVVWQGLTVPVNVYIGGAVTPGSLTIGGSQPYYPGAYDKGGVIYLGAQQVGTIDYENGLMSLNGLNTAGGATIPITYSPAAVPLAVQQSQGIAVTQENRSRTWIRTLQPIPVPGTTRVDYCAQGRWYVLRDDGSGALRGADSSYGAGVINFSTGTLSVTLGELPDAETAVIVQWTPDEAMLDTTEITLHNSGSLYMPFNTSGQISEEAGAKAIEPGGLSIDWVEPGTSPLPKSASDNGAGQLVGDASGTVDYARGVVKFSMTSLRAPGTLLTMNLSTRDATEAAVTVVGGVGNLGVTNIAPGSLSFGVAAQRKVQFFGSGADGSVVDVGSDATYLVRDNGAGGLVVRVGDFAVPCGTVDYATGEFELSGSVALNAAQSFALLKWENLFVRESSPSWSLAVQ